MDILQVVYEDEGSPPYNNLTQQSIRTEVDSIETKNTLNGPVQYILRKAVYKIVQREVPIQPIASVADRLEALELIVNGIIS